MLFHNSSYPKAELEIGVKREFIWQLMPQHMKRILARCRDKQLLMWTYVKFESTLPSVKRLKIYNRYIHSHNFKMHFTQGNLRPVLVQENFSKTKNETAEKITGQYMFSS